MKEKPTGAERLFSRMSETEFADELAALPETEEEKADSIPDPDDEEETVEDDGIYR